METQYTLRECINGQAKESTFVVGSTESVGYAIEKAKRLYIEDQTNIAALLVEGEVIAYTAGNDWFLYGQGA